MAAALCPHLCRYAYLCTYTVLHFQGKVNGCLELSVCGVPVSILLRTMNHSKVWLYCCSQRHYIYVFKIFAAQNCTFLQKGILDLGEKMAMVEAWENSSGFRSHIYLSMYLVHRHFNKLSRSNKKNGYSHEEKTLWPLLTFSQQSQYSWVHIELGSTETKCILQI